MNRKIKILFSVYFVLLSNEILSQNWLPYYSFNFSEGVYIPSVGRWGWSTVLSNEIGSIFKPAQAHTGLFYYQLKYTGPGLKRQEGELFEQRSMAHSLVLQYSYKYGTTVFKTRLTYDYDFWRSGTNELWGLGLYDNERIGLTEEVEYKMNDEITLKGLLGYKFIKFPNYTNLIEEYIAGAEETAAGKQDNHMFMFSTKAKYNFHNVGLMMILQNYVKQQVLSENATYSDKKQQDYNIELSYYYDILKLANLVTLNPYFAIKYKDSNQAFLYLTSYDITTSTPLVVQDYYDYLKFSLSLPVNFQIATNKMFTFNPEFELTSYLSRQPRDENNNFIHGKKQQNLLLLLSLIYTSQSTDRHRKVSVFYTYQQQSSNTKFEKYYPYNYSGHYFGIRFSYSY